MVIGCSTQPMMLLAVFNLNSFVSCDVIGCSFVKLCLSVETDWLSLMLARQAET